MLVPVEPAASTVYHESLAAAQRPYLDAAVSELHTAGAQLLALDSTACTPISLHRVAASMHRIAGALEECEAAGLERDALLPHVQALRDLNGRSPFVRRLQTWPRGYPGDFETVEWLCDGENRADAGTVPWAIEQFALQSPVAQQHRNKVLLQADAMRVVIAAQPAARIASIGCGGCRDLRLLARELRDTDATFTLIDGDDGALAFAAACLGSLASRCTFVRGRVPRVLGRVRSQAPFDLVIAGGLFDYLPDRWAVETLRHVRTLLRPGGTLVFSNIATGNPYRPWLVYLADWMLIERTEDDILALLDDAGFERAGTSIRRDVTGLAAMVTARLMVR